MTAPRPVVPGRTYLATRRCSERRFFLRPDDRVTQAYWYCLGLAAQKHGIDLVAAVAMSNHCHEIVIDRNGNYPEFIRDFHALLARCVNALRGRFDAFWEADQTSMVELPDAQSQLEKVVYVLANPVAADLVEKAHHWPGATALDAIVFDKTVTVRRPAHFFRNAKMGGALPETVTLRFVRPPEWEQHTHAEFLAHLKPLVAEAECVAEGERRKSGRTVLGRHGVLNQSWKDSPRTREDRFGISPRVACRSKWRRIEALGRNRHFHVCYRASFLDARTGIPTVWPHGTYLRRLHTGVECHPDSG